MNQDLQNLEIKVENDGATPQGRLTATEWNILVAAVKSLDLTGGSADVASILQVVANAGYATQEWVTSQKYITSSALDNLAKNLVTLDTTQAITGMKDFTNGLKIGGLPVYKLNDSTIFVDANLVVTGAFTMHGSGSTTFPTIWANIPFDSTMRWNGSQWSVVGGGSSSGSGGGISIADVENYLTGNGYITSDALEPYALESAIPTNTNQLTNGAGFITGITSSMVTNALGYTPLSTSGGTITGEVTITAVANSPLKINSNATDSGVYFNHNGISKTWVGFEASRGSVLYHSVGSHRLGINNDGVAFYDSNTLLHSGNYSDYALPKDGTAVAASKLATTRSIWGQSFDGSADVSGNIFPINANGCYYNENGILYHTNKQYQASILRVTSSYDVAIGGTTALDKLHVYGAISSENTNADAGFRARGSTYALFFGIGSGNVNRGIYDDYHKGWWIMRGADKTTTIDGSMVASGLRINQSAFNNGLTLNRTSANAGAGIVFRSNDGLLGQIGINGTKTFEVSDGTTIKASIEIPTGNLLIKGVLTMNYSSDERLKKNIRKVNASEVLMSLGGVYQYEYIDSEVAKNSIYGGSHYGLIYQNVKGTALDKMCHKREDGFGALNYLDTNFISLIAGATMENISEIEKLKKANRELKKKVEQLEKRVA